MAPITFEVERSKVLDPGIEAVLKERYGDNSYFVIREDEKVVLRVTFDKGTELGPDDFFLIQTAKFQHFSKLPDKTVFLGQTYDPSTRAIRETIFPGKVEPSCGTDEYEWQPLSIQGLRSFIKNFHERGWEMGW